MSGKPVNDPVIQDFLRRIKPLRGQIQKLILFGSRARGDEKPFSDYDVLIVIEKKDRTLKNALYDAVVETLLSTGREISLKIMPRPSFDLQAGIPTFFMRNILTQGIPLG